MFLPWHFANEDKHMLDATTRTMLDALAGKLLRAVDHRNDEGDMDAALMMRDAAEGVLALLDADAARRRAAGLD